MSLPSKPLSTKVGMSSNSSNFLVIVDVPSGLEFGIDIFQFTTGPNFGGMSLLPDGLHLVYHSSGAGVRQGFFVSCKNAQVLAHAWDKGNEEISSKCTYSPEQMQELQIAIARGTLNHKLGPYPLDQYHKYKNLSNFINLDVLNICDLPLGVSIMPGDAEDMQSLYLQSLNQNQKQDSKVPNIKEKEKATSMKPYFADSARVARFCDINAFEASLRENIQSNVDAQWSPREKAAKLSSFYLDRSIIMEHIKASHFNSSSSLLLGEIQLSFLLFLILFSYPAMQHWKESLILICNSESFLSKHKRFTINFMRMVYEQLNYVGEDFFEEELSRDNFLKPCLGSLFAVTAPKNDSQEGNDLEELQETRKRLLQFVKMRFGIFGTNEDICVPKGAPKMNNEQMDEEEDVVVDDDGSDGSDGDGESVIISDIPSMQQDLAENTQLDASFFSRYSEQDILIQASQGSTEMYNMHGEDAPTLVLPHELTISHTNSIGNATNNHDITAESMQGGDIRALMAERWMDFESKIDSLGLLNSQQEQQSPQRLDGIGIGIHTTVLPPRQIHRTVNDDSSAGDVTPSTIQDFNEDDEGYLSFTREIVVPIAEEGGVTANTSASIDGIKSPSNVTGMSINSTTPVSRHEMQVAMFSWRYPSLYDAMVAASKEGVEEDLLMTAMRVLSIEEGQKGDTGEEAVLNEARTFLESECDHESMKQGNSNVVQ